MFKPGVIYPVQTKLLDDFYLALFYVKYWYKGRLHECNETVFVISTLDIIISCLGIATIHGSTGPLLLAYFIELWFVIGLQSELIFLWYIQLRKKRNGFCFSMLFVY